jgi:hypothetical protein
MSRDDQQAAPSETSRDHPESDPAAEALIELLDSEHMQALDQRPDLVSKVDPGRLWLLWFAIGATIEVCTRLGREVDREGNQLFRQVAGRVFIGGIQSGCDPILADSRLIDLFESAGAAAVAACMRGDERLGYYLAGLRVSADRGTPPLVN